MLGAAIMSTHPPRVLVSLALASVAGCGSPSEPTPTPTAATPAPTASEGAKAVTPAVEPKAAPAEPTPAPAEPTVAAPAPTELAPAVPTSSTLRAAAVREGAVELLSQRDAPLLVIDGEPLAFADGSFVRHAAGSRGLWPNEPTMAEQSLTLAAASLGDELGAWTSTVHEVMRSASFYEVYRRDAEQWVPVPLRKGLLVASYTALVERDGALLALQTWAADPLQEVGSESEEPDPKAAAYFTKVTRALARAKPQWVRIAGAPDVVLPEIPSGMVPSGTATTTPDGTLMALFEAPGAEGEGTRPTLLLWRAGQAKAEPVEVPGLAKTRMTALGRSGEWALVGGTFDGSDAAEESYLALGRGSEWQRVPVTLPGRSSSATATISGAARLPDGELWIALGNRFEGGGDAEPVWRKPVDGAWQPVPLPTVGGDAFGPADAWVRDTQDEDRGWVATTRSPSPLAPEQAIDLVSAGGAVWIVVQGQTAFDDVGAPPPRTVVLTNASGTAPPTVLPAAWELRLERRNHAVRSSQPGQTGCKSFAIVLGPPTAASSVHEALVKLELPAEGDDDPPTIRSIYTGQHDGVEVAVAEAHAESPAQATALRDAAVKAMEGLGAPHDEVAAQCPIPRLERMVHPPKPPGE